MKWIVLCALLLGGSAAVSAQERTCPPQCEEQPPLVDPVRVLSLMLGVQPDEAPKGDTSVIDVVVFLGDTIWRTKCGNTVAGATACVQPGVDQWNTAKANEADAGTIPGMALLGVVHTDFVEGQTCHGDSMLYWAADPTCGGYTSIMAELRRVGADLAVLTSNASGDNCGLGWMFVTADGMPMSSSHWDGCTIPNLSLIHEVGHNVGLQHEPLSACSALTCPGFNYGYGWGGPLGTTGQSKERDPMTYPRENGQRVLYWSTPKKTRTINGVAYVIGTATQNDNLRQLVERGPIVAGFRERVATPPPPTPAPRYGAGMLTAH